MTRDLPGGPLDQAAIDLIVAEYESTHPLDHRANVRTESREGGRRFVAACVCGWTGLFAWRGRAKAQGEADDHEAYR